MKNTTLGEYKDINSFVEAKLSKFDSMDRNFATMFELAFAETDNILYESFENNTIVKTTYGQAKQQILSLAAYFCAQMQERQIPAGSVIGLHMNNSLSWIEAYWMILAAGYRPMLMNLRLSGEVLEQALKDGEAKLVVSDGMRFSVPTMLFSEISEIEAHSAGQTSENAERAKEQCGKEQCAKEPSGKEQSANEKQESRAFGTEILVMSSGTSDSLKICAYTAEEFYYQIHDSYDIIRKCTLMKKHYEGELKQLTFLPFYHVFGLIAVYIWFSFFSRTFVDLKSFAPDELLGTIRRHKVTHIFAVPLLWETVYNEAMKTIHAQGEKTYKKFTKALAISNKDIPVISPLIRKFGLKQVRDQLFGESIRFLIAGGSSIEPAVLEFFNGIGYHLADGYGMTEIGITSVELSMKRKVLNSAAVGQPMSSIEYRVSDEGELLVRGKATAAYIIEKGEKRPRPEWFHTRDIAEVRDGHYYINGRIDDLIIGANGENINPNLIEPIFKEHGFESCLLAMTDPDTKATVPTLITSVGRDTTPEKLEEIKTSLRELISSKGLSGSIGKLIFVTSPLMGPDDFKLNRRLIRERYQNGELASLTDKPAEEDTSDMTNKELLNLLKELFADALRKKPEEISIYSDFFLDEGGDSMGYLLIMSRLQNEYKLEYPTDLEKSLNSIREIYEYVEAELEKRAHVFS